MYETMAVWDGDEFLAGEPEVVHDYARIWRDADKVVYSRTLEALSSARTTVEREFEPDAVRSTKASADRDISIGGPEIAAEAMRAGLVDEIHLFMHPISVGAGKRALPADLRIELELLDERRFASGAVHLHYRVAG
jgi:dihydrofolate reductase